jgi:hypothetical protein
MKTISATRRLTLGLVLTLLLFIPWNRSSGDIGVFGGFGQTVFPIKSEDVRMVSEYVVISIGPQGKEGPLESLPDIEVKATFLLENESDQAVTVQMGFPDQFGRGLRDERPRSLVRKFAVRTNREAALFQKKRNEAPEEGPSDGYEEVFVWSCSFAPREKKTIEVQYMIRMSALATFDLADTDEPYKLSKKEAARIRRFYQEMSPFVHKEIQEMWDGPGLRPQAGQELWMVQSGLLLRTAYLLQTGALWKGRIGDARVEVNLTRFLNSVEPLEVSGDIFGGYTFALIKPGGFQWKGKSLLWEMKNVEPEEDIQVGFLTVCYIPRDAATLKRWLSTDDGAKLSTSTLAMLKDCVLACHGQASKDPQLKTFFENSVPYQAAKYYPSKSLPRTAQEIVAEIDSALKNRGQRGL